MNDPTAPLRLSIALEWDNVRLSETSRARRMLERLADQLRPRIGADEAAREGGVRLASPVQILLVFDPDGLGDAHPERVVGEALAGLGADIDLTPLPVAGQGYYELKNRAVQWAGGEIVLLLDSDVIPEPDWLEHLLAPFADPDVCVVGSTPYIEPSSTYAKAFALGWLFPPRTADGSLHAANRFYSNSAAFRTDVLRRHPFPPLPGASRGAGSLLAEELIEAGIPIHRSPRARVAHPAPRPRHFVRRALAQGRDNLLNQRARSKAGDVPLGRSWRRIRGRTATAWRRFARSGERVGMSRAEIAPAALVITVYYGLVLAGDVLTRIAPDGMARRFRI